MPAVSEVSGLVQLVRLNIAGLHGVTPPPLPAKAQTPYVTIHSIIATDLENLEGRSGLVRALMQLNVWHVDYERAWVIREAIKDLLIPFTGDCGNGRIISAVNHGPQYGAGDTELYDTVRQYHQLVTRLAIYWDGSV